MVKSRMGLEDLQSGGEEEDGVGGIIGRGSRGGWGWCTVVAVVLKKMGWGDVISRVVVVSWLY